MQVSKVLVVDGNRTARDTLVTCLQFVGVEAHGAACAISAREFIPSVDVIVLTDELIDLGFAEILQLGAARASILMLRREGASADIQTNYHVDDTLHRPVALSYLVERVESLLDQRRMTTGISLVFGGLTLDVATQRARVGGNTRLLGPTEARLLGHFMGVPDKVFSRAQLLQKLWPSNVRVAERTVDVHIRRLRSVLEPLGCAHYIQTVRSAGYRFSLREN
jgi:two-component system, OmpR family, phosphate regulon response regulator PhoB